MMNVWNLLACDIDIDPIVPAFTSGCITVLKIVIPIILIVLGMIDLAKAVMSNDDKVMKEAQGKLIKRIVYAVIIFFVVAIVQFVFGLLGSASDNASDSNMEYNKDNITSCINCFVNNEDCNEE